ncbi:MAG: ParB/RepB/Spo0J family partition protein [Magnetococcales bacterium]|nr:ParB/RepB/Spo0J family partition protein [Magnetococcales bacterium]
MKDSKLAMVPLADIRIDADVNPRKESGWEKIDGMVSSIKNHGIINPVGCRKEGDDIVLVCGYRRMEAAKRIGLKEVPVHFTDKDPAVIAIIENFQREDLSAIEMGEALHSLMESRGLKQIEMAGLINRSPETVSELNSLAKLPDEIKQEFRKDNNIPQKLLVKAARAKDPKEQRRIINGYKRKLDEKSEPQRNDEEQQKRSPAEAILTAVGNLEKRILKAEGLVPEEKESIHRAIVDLMPTVHDRISTNDVLEVESYKHEVRQFLARFSGNDQAQKSTLVMFGKALKQVIDEDFDGEEDFYEFAEHAFGIEFSETDDETEDLNTETEGKDDDVSDT